MKISLCVTSHNPNLSLLYKMLDSAIGFDEKIIHIESREKASCTAAQGFNKVIAAATSEFICPFCDDDFFHTNNLKELLTWFHNTNIKEDIIRFPIFGGNENFGWQEWLHPEPTYEGLRKQNLLPFSCFYRKSLWDRVEGYDDLRFCDWGFWLKAYKQGVTVHTWPKPIYYFRNGVEERLSDKEMKSQDFEISRQQLIKRAEEV